MALLYSFPIGVSSKIMGRKYIFTKKRGEKCELIKINDNRGGDRNSFHETKNYVMGEGGALILTNNDDLLKAEIIREKGTNRSQFLKGFVQRYDECVKKCILRKLNSLRYLRPFPQLS